MKTPKIELANQKTVYGLIVSAVCTFVIRILMLCVSSNYFINPDRIGDLAAPITLARNDWSALIPMVGYYGYGFKWIFFLFFRQTENPYIIYYEMMLLFVVLYSLLAGLIYYIQYRFMGAEEHCIEALCLSVLFGVWGPADFKSEPSIYLACWIALFLFLRAIYAKSKLGRNVWSAIIALWLSYCMTLHERMLAFVLAFCIAVVLYAIKYRKWMVSPAIYFPCQLVFYFLVEVCNDSYREYFWGTADVLNSSAVSGVASVATLEALRSGSMYKIMLQCFVSNIVTMTINTYGLAWVVVLLFLYLFFQRKHATELEFLLNVYVIAALVVIAGLMLNWGKGVYSDDLYGYKGFVYHRYYICFIYPAIMIAIYWLIKNKHKINVKVIAISLATLLMTNMLFIGWIYPVLYSAYISYTPTGTTSNTCLEWLTFYSFQGDIKCNYLACFGICLSLLIIGWMRWCKAKNLVPVYLLVLFCVVGGATSWYNFATPRVEFNGAGYRELYEWFADVKANGIDCSAEYIYTDTYPYPMQYVLNRYTVAIFDDSQNQDIKLFVSTQEPRAVKQFLPDAKEYQYLSIGGGFVVYVRESEYLDQLLDAGYEFRELNETDFVVNYQAFDLAMVEEKYRIIVVNDLHMIAETNQVMEEYTELVNTRRTVDFVNAEGVPSADTWLEYIDYINELDADLVVFAGDMVDFASETNYDLLQQGLEQIKAPVIYLRSDHDYSRHYTSDFMTAEEVADLQANLIDNSKIQTYDLGECILLGWNDSWDNISEESLQQVRDVVTIGKPIILVTHVPFDSTVDDAFRERCYAIRGVYNMWGEDDRYVPNEQTTSLFQLIMDEDATVSFVLSAHLHYKDEVELGNNVWEYVMAPGYDGTINEIEIF